MKKHTATILGATLTRNSASRTYTHVVVHVQTVAERHAELAERAAESVRYELGYARKTIARGVEGGMREYRNLGRDYFVDAIAKAEALLARDEAALVGEALHRAMERLDPPNGDGHYVGAFTWCGTYQRALQEKNSHVRKVRNGRVLLLEAAMRDTKAAA